MSDFLNLECSSATSAENSDNNSETEYTGFFEGPEKTMEVVFRTGSGNDDGLRALTRAQLDHLCTLAKCSILTTISTSHVDSYVLSESSLFVYRYKYIMKTCGTTTLLRCLHTLLIYADELKLELQSVIYSRKNLICPTAQLWPHSSFGDEIKYINNHANLQDRLHGNGYILGPVTGDHWFVYCADLTPVSKGGLKTNFQSCDSLVSAVSNASNANPLNDPVIVQPTTRLGYSGFSDRTINMMMFDLAPEVCEIFMKEQSGRTGKEMTKLSRIGELCPGATIDETAFTPCGYSMNALLHDSYSTVHITPEAACSYASFETNTELSNYSALMRNALSVFRPKRFVVTMFGDEKSIYSLAELPTDLRRFNAAGNFIRTSVASTKIESNMCCLMACFTLEEATTSVPVSPSVGVDAPISKLAASSSKTSLVGLLQKNTTDGRPRGYSIA